MDGAYATRWHGLELRHLRVLVAVADARSFSAAAATLGYVQSTVSHAVAALEAAVGTTLVRRRPAAGERPLTREGEALAAHARRILAELRRAEAELLARRPGLVQVAVEADSARFLLRELYRAAARMDISIEAVEVGDGAARALLSGSCTLGAGEATDDAALAVRPFLRDRFVVVEPARSSRRGEVTAAELRSAPVVVHAGREAHLLRALELRGAAPAPALRAPSDHAVLELVGAGLGCAIVPELALRSPLADDVVVRPLASELELPPRVVSFAWLRADGLGERERTLLRALAAARPAPGRPCAAAA